MELKNTVSMMQRDDFKERFRAEYFQLKNRLTGLNNMLKKFKERKLNFVPKCSYELLHTQSVYMECYLNTLEERARIEDISLQE